jgi:hypothetical protein
MRRVFVCLWLLVGLAGCATSINPLSLQEIGDLKITEVRVVLKPDASIWWGAAERQYNASLPKPKVGEPKEVPADSPEMVAHLRKRLSDMVHEVLTRRVAPRFQTGQRAVVLESRVHGMTIPSEVQRIALGGTPVFAATTHLIDTQTGQELARLDQGTAATFAPGGVWVVATLAMGMTPLENQLMENYADQVLSWLLKK